MSVTLPPGRYVAVARLLSGGFASRLDLPFEAVDSLQLAVELALRAAVPPGEEVTIDFGHDGTTVTLAISPVTADVLQTRLGGADDGADLGVLLGRLVDTVEVVADPPSLVLRASRHLTAR